MKLCLGKYQESTIAPKESTARRLYLYCNLHVVTVSLVSREY